MRSLCASYSMSVSWCRQYNVPGGKYMLLINHTFKYIPSTSWHFLLLCLFFINWNISKTWDKVIKFTQKESTINICDMEKYRDILCQKFNIFLCQFDETRIFNYFYTYLFYLEKFFFSKRLLGLVPSVSYPFFFSNLHRSIGFQDEHLRRSQRFHNNLFNSDDRKVPRNCG